MTIILSRRTGSAGRRRRDGAGSCRIACTPTVPYPATIARPCWFDLPRPVRDEIDHRSRQPVIDPVASRAGFTATFASVLTHADDSRSFCKAAPADTPAAAAYAREAAIVALLPPAVPAARLRWRSHHADWIITAYDLADGTPLGPGWTTTSAAAAFATVRQTAQALTDASPALRVLARRPQPLRAGWSDVAAQRRPLPPQARHLMPLAASMARWEHQFLAAADSTDELGHFDARPDNLVIGGGRTRLVDWATLQPGPAYVDAVTLLVAAADDGADPQRLLDQTATAISNDELDAVLAWLAGAWLTFAAGPARPDSPHLRAHQLRSGLHAWQWLAARHGLPTAPAGPA